MIELDSYVRIKDDRVPMYRSKGYTRHPESLGVVTSILPGDRVLVRYNTAYGYFCIEVDTHDLDIIADIERTV